MQYEEYIVGANVLNSIDIHAIKVLCLQQLVSVFQIVAVVKMSKVATVIKSWYLPIPSTLEEFSQTERVHFQDHFNRKYCKETPF